MNKICRLFCAMLAAVFILTISSQVAFADDAETYYLTWEEYMEANGVTDWNYNDLAAVIAGVANHAVDLYEAGDKDQAYTYAKATYWGFYETSGFERNTMNYISGSRVSEVELAFTTLRKAIKKDNGLEAVRAAADSLINKLTEDGAILSPEGPVFAKASGASAGADAVKGQAAVLDTYYLTWEEHMAAYGVTDWNYNDLASVIAGVANHAVELYKAGEMEDSYAYAKATYWGYYETSGFERNTMNLISGSRVSEVELAFTTLRKAIKKDNGVEAVQAAADALTSKLFEDAMILSPEGPVMGGAAAGTEAKAASAGNSKASATGIAVFLGAFAIILREGLEAILIVGAIIAYLIKTGNKNQVVPVYIGSALGVVCSFIMAGIINMLLARSAEYHMSQEIIEGIAALTAVVVLFWVSNWMVSKSEAAVWSQYIEGRVASSATRGNILALGFTAWLAVFREGAEVILFYQPMLAENRPDMVWAGFAVGVLCLVVIYLLIRFMSVRLPLKPFFMGTSILMAVMSISFLGAGIKELMEGGVLDGFEWAIYSPTWLSWIPYNDVLDVLGIYPLIGTIVPQLILLAITIVTFVMHLKHNKKVRLEAEKTQKTQKAEKAEKEQKEAK